MTTNSHLSESQRHTLAFALQEQLTALEHQKESFLQGMSQTEHTHQILLEEVDDAIQRAGAHEVEAIVSDIDSKEFDEVSNALQRIHDTDYGLCVDCRMAIPFERLKVEPQAQRCIACEISHERKN